MTGECVKLVRVVHQPQRTWSRDSCAALWPMLLGWGDLEYQCKGWMEGNEKGGPPAAAIARKDCRGKACSLGADPTPNALLPKGRRLVQPRQA